MMRAGEYPFRFEHLQRTDGTRDGFGQRTDTYPSQGYLWGGLENTSASRAGAKESDRQVTTATVRLRNYPDVLPGDRLRDVQWGDTWTVETATRGDNELICEVTRPRWKAAGGTA